MNPRVQVEHTVTEEVTASTSCSRRSSSRRARTLADLGLDQATIREQAHARCECRVTTEDPAHDFRPDTGAIESSARRAAWASGSTRPGFVGAQITPHYDSLLMKVTARAATRLDAATKLQRALRELRVRGVKTNKQFLLNVLRHPDFLHQTVNTSFIAQNPELLSPALTANRANKLLKYVAHVTVNGPPADLGAQPGVRVAPLDPRARP